MLDSRRMADTNRHGTGSPDLRRRRVSPAHRARWEAFLATHHALYPAAQQACLAELVRATGHDFVGELLEDLWRDGAARAAEMAEAAARDDLQRVERAAHTLKSMGRALGFERLGAACVRIEEAVRGGTLGAFRLDLADIERELENAKRLRAVWSDGVVAGAA